MVAAAGALVTKMVIAAFAGMGAATICHPLGECVGDVSLMLQTRTSVGG